MRVALRSYATAGVALVGAAVIVANPLQPTLPDIRVAAPGVQPSASYSELFQSTANSLETLLPLLAENPLPVLSQILSNQIQSASAVLTPTVDIVVGSAGYVLRLPLTAVQAIQALFAADGGFNAAVAALVQPLAPLALDVDELSQAVGEALQQPFRNLINAFETLNVENVAILGVTAISPLIATVVATAQAVNAVAFASNSGETFDALLNFMPTVTDGFLNGADLGSTTVDIPRLLPQLIAEFIPAWVPDEVIDQLPNLIPDVVVSGRVGGVFSTGFFNLDLSGDPVTAHLEVPGFAAGMNYFLRQLAAAIDPTPDVAPAPQPEPAEPEPMSAEPEVGVSETSDATDASVEEPAAASEDAEPELSKDAGVEKSGGAEVAEAEVDAVEAPELEVAELKEAEAEPAKAAEASDDSTEAEPSKDIVKQVKEDAAKESEESAEKSAKKRSSVKAGGDESKAGTEQAKDDDAGDDAGDSD